MGQNLLTRAKRALWLIVPVAVVLSGAVPAGATTTTALAQAANSNGGTVVVDARSSAPTTALAAASPAEVAAASATCGAGSVPAGRFWNGTEYVPFGVTGFARLSAVAPNTVPITVSKSYDPDGTGTVGLQVFQVGTLTNTTLTGGVVVARHSTSTINPGGYAQILYITNPGVREVRVVVLCVKFGGIGEPESDPESGWFPVPADALYPPTTP